MSDAVIVARSVADFVDQKRKTAAIVPGVTVRMEAVALAGIVEALRLAADEAERERQQRTTSEALHRLAFEVATKQKAFLDLMDASPLRALFWFFTQRAARRVQAWWKL